MDTSTVIMKNEAEGTRSFIGTEGRWGSDHRHTHSWGSQTEAWWGEPGQWDRLVEARNGPRRFIQVSRKGQVIKSHDGRDNKKEKSSDEKVK